MAPTSLRPRSALAAGLAVLSLGLSHQAEARKKKKSEPPPAARPKLPLLDDDSPSGPSVVAVVVGLGSGSDDAANALLGTAEGSIRKSGRPLVRISDALDSAGAAARADASKKGDSQLKAANRAYNEGDLEICGDLGERADSTLQTSDLTRTFPRLVRAWVLELASDGSTPAKANKVQSELEQIFAAAPKTDIPDGLLPADAQKQVEPTRAKMRSGSGALKVDSKPAGAQVYVDNAFRGATPLSLSDLAPGGHTVIAFKPGTVWVVKHITTPGDASVSLNLDATPDGASWSGKVDTIRRAFHSSSVTGPAAQVASLAHADQVLVVGVESKSGSLQAMAVRIDGKSSEVLADLDTALPSSPDGRASALSDLVSKALASDHQSSSHRLSGGSASASASTATKANSSSPPPTQSKPAESKPTETAKAEPTKPEATTKTETTTKASPPPTDSTPPTGDNQHRPPKDLGEDITE